MDLPGNVLDGISRFFDGDVDEILFFLLVFLFFFLTGSEDGKNSEGGFLSGVIPIVLIVLFLFFSINNTAGANLLT